MLLYWGGGDPGGGGHFFIAPSLGLTKDRTLAQCQEALQLHGGELDDAVVYLLNLDSDDHDDATDGMPIQLSAPPETGEQQVPWHGSPMYFCVWPRTPAIPLDSH